HVSSSPLTSQVPENVQKERPSTLDDPLDFMFGINVNSVVMVPPLGVAADSDHFPTSENALTSAACALASHAPRMNPKKVVAAMMRMCHCLLGAGSQCSAIFPPSSRNMSNQVVVYFFAGSFGSTASRTKTSVTKLPSARMAT